MPAGFEDGRARFAYPSIRAAAHAIAMVDVLDRVAVTVGEGFERIVPPAGGHAEVEDVVRFEG